MKHAASVRPEPGSNSPLSESFYFVHHRWWSSSFLTLAFAICFVCNALALLTVFLESFLKLTSCCLSQLSFQLFCFQCSDIFTTNASQFLLCWLSGYLSNRSLAVPLYYYVNFYCQVVFEINFKNLFCYSYSVFKIYLCAVHVYYPKTKKIKMQALF